jgi:hypothetical protein
MLLMGGLHEGMQCNVEFWYELRICSRTEENHGKLWSILILKHYLDERLLQKVKLIYTL